MSADKHPRAAAMRRSLPLLAAAFLTGYLAFFAPGSARAAAFTVNSTIDAVDANPGDGACASASGECTLRAAVPETNAMPGPNTILMPAGTYLLSIFGGFDDAAASGDLDVNDELEIHLILRPHVPPKDFAALGINPNSGQVSRY